MANLNQIYAALSRSLNPISGGPIGRRSAAESQLRYLPALQALLLLGQQNNTAYKQGVQGVKRGGYAAAGGIGQVRSNFLQQLSDTQAPTSEAAAHLGLTRDAVAGELAKMQANQIGGISSNVNQLRQKHTQDVADVVRQLFQTAQQGSLYNTSQYEALAADQRKSQAQAKQWAIAQRNALVRAHINPQTGKYDPSLAPPPRPRAPHAPVDGVDYQTYLSMTPAQRRANHQAWVAAGHTGSSSTNGIVLPGGVKPLSQGEHNTFRREVLNAQHWAQILRKGGGDRQQIATALSIGGKAQSGTTIPSFDQDVINAALDLAFLNGISRHTHKVLNSMGYSTRMLNFPLYTPQGGVVMHNRKPSKRPADGDPTGRFG